MEPYSLKDRPCIIRTNYGDESLALTQWAYEANLLDQTGSVTVAYVETGWQSSSWQARVEAGEQHAVNCGFNTIRIPTTISFTEAVIGRGTFPSERFQWCTGLLKGLPFLDWIDTFDLRAQAVILIAKRRQSAQAHQTLSEWIQACEYHQGRTVWHPILEIDHQERNALLSRAGFLPLEHRSLECHPCIHSTQADMNKMSQKDWERLRAVEQTLGTPFTIDCIQNAKKINTSLDCFYRGCGNPFGCGM